MKFVELAAFIYVRYDSSRLYGKVLKKIENKTLIKI
jgi:CMP-2-keto-3-deoxyoctulosonic acid synthetase